MKKGSAHSDAARAKMRQARLGRRLDEATRAKLSASARKFWKRMKRLAAQGEAARAA